MRREIVDVRAAAAREFESVARRWKELLEHVQNGVAVALCGPIHVGAKGTMVDNGLHAGHEALHLAPKQYHHPRYYYPNLGTSAKPTMPWIGSDLVPARA
ncbi:MAG: hypothetical protein USCAAHI_01148 [Beijerinckiaceae bacterium]|nr:MAG: hypothetical protein USCAAHI_01148 [Beijerinckiaceae bacterium]